MENQEASLKQLFHRALVNPLELSPEDFELLMRRYPYAQPLYFAFERRKFLLGESERLGHRAVLLASSPNWLYEYVRKPVEEAPLVDVVDDDYVPFEELSWSADAFSAALPPQEAPAQEEAGNVEEQSALSEGYAQPQSEIDQVAPAEEDGRDVLETLVQEGIGGGDYFTVHAKEMEAVEPATEQDLPKKEEGDISLYNDQLMPYSFRWWLHKTRLEYADTYQPFASPHLPVNNKPAFDPEELDKIILDQQIREHIIHLQDPEDKLSEAVKQRAAAYNRKDKTAEVIERFIREEPQIQPPPAENLNTENKARKSSEEQYDLVTETLATIYADQGMYVKAIEVYKKLILRFPEKKSYFATRIKELEEKLY